MPAMIWFDEHCHEAKQKTEHRRNDPEACCIKDGGNSASTMRKVNLDIVDKRIARSDRHKESMPLKIGGTGGG
jgi:hypothetical protein